MSERENSCCLGGFAKNAGESCSNQVPSQLRNLVESTDLLLGNIDKLENALSPVLRNEPSCPEEPGKCIETLVPAAEAIRIQRLRVENAADRITDILRRLEI